MLTAYTKVKVGPMCGSFVHTAPQTIHCSCRVSCVCRSCSVYKHLRVLPLSTLQTDIPGESKFEAFLSEMQSIRESLCEDRQEDEEPSEGKRRWDVGTRRLVCECVRAPVSRTVCGRARPDSLSVRFAQRGPSLGRLCGFQYIVTIEASYPCIGSVCLHCWRICNEVYSASSVYGVLGSGVRSTSYHIFDLLSCFCVQPQPCDWLTLGALFEITVVVNVHVHAHTHTHAHTYVRTDTKIWALLTVGVFELVCLCVCGVFVC